MPLDSTYFKKKLKSHKQIERRKKGFEKEIRKSEFILKLNKQHPESDINSLVDTIVRKKSELLGLSDYLYEEWDEFHLQYMEYAHKLLELILSKKLFNRELEWRAEEITIPEVQVTSDFELWARDISNCPFLEPVTEKEIEVLKMYMRTNNFEIKNWSWESGLDYDFDDYMKKNEKGDLDQLPEFFEFYDGMMGTFYLLNKPDYRTEKEDRYVKLYWAKRHKTAEKRKEKIEAGTLPEPPLYFDPFGKDGDIILKQTEPEDYWELEEQMKVRDLHPYFHQRQLEEIAEYFKRNPKDDICLPAWQQWDEAMDQAYNQHRNARALEVLELALEEYNMKAEMGLFNTRDVEKEKKKSYHRKFILEGRKIAGEKRDFEF